MKKTANIIYLILGTIMPILIGGLHTYAHFKDLTTEHVQSLLNQKILVTGQTQIAYNTWGLMSFMMGFSFIIIGLLHFALMRHRGWDKYPSIIGCFIILLYLLGVIYAANIFNASPQFYGSIFGIVLILICLVITRIGNKKETL